MESTHSFRIVVAFSLLATLAVAQDPYGFSTVGTGGITPVLSANQAWVGRTDFGITIDQGLGGTPAVILISLLPDQAIQFGLPIWVDLNTLVVQAPVNLGGTIGVPGDGSATYTASLAGIPPFAAGFQFFTQAAIFDFVGGLPVVTNGVACELTLPPQVFVGTSVGGSADPHWFVDPTINALAHPTGTSNTDNADGAVFAHAGRYLYVTNGITGDIRQADLTGASPVWSSFHNFGTGIANGLEFDKGRNLLWTIANIAGPGNPSQLELVAMDAALGSPTYGSVLFQSNGLSGIVGLIGVWTLSPNGNMIVVPSLLATNVFVFDSDPGSGTFLQLTQLLSMPFSGTSPFFANTQAKVSPDNDQIWILRQATGSTPAELNRYSMLAGIWFDHNPVAPGVQPLGAASMPPMGFLSAPTGMAFAPHGGNFVVVSGFGGPGWAGRIDYDPTNPASFSYTAASGTTMPNAYRCAVNSDGTLVAITSWSPARLLFFDTTTMGFVGDVSLTGGGSNIYTVAWR